VLAERVTVKILERLVPLLTSHDADDNPRTFGADASAEKRGERGRPEARCAARPLLLSAPGSAAEHLRVSVAKEITVIASLDPYLTLKAAAEYGGVSVRWLRTALTDPVHPLPCYRPGGKGGKVLLRRSDFDTWMARFRAVGDADLDAIVRGVVEDVA
jgi:excisionase family DNA binding protein